MNVCEQARDDRRLWYCQVSRVYVGVQIHFTKKEIWGYDDFQPQSQALSPFPPLSWDRVVSLMRDAFVTQRLLG